MKKRTIFSAAAALALCCCLGGCMNSTAKKAMEEAKLSVAAGDYTAAMNYGSFALKEGCNDPEFIALTNCLKAYDSAKKALDSGDTATAESQLAAAGGNDDGTMSAAIAALSQSVEERKAEIAEDNEALDEAEDDINNGYFSTARSELREIDKSRLTDIQAQRFDELEAAAEAADEDEDDDSGSSYQRSETSGGRTYISADEAEQIVRREKDIDDDAQFRVTDKGDYFQILVTQYFTDPNGQRITDEYGCMVDKLTGEIYNEAG